MSTAIFAFVAFVQTFEVVRVTSRQAGAFRRAHQRPIATALDAFHEKIGNPQRVEKISRARFLFAVIFFEIQKFKDVGVPGFEVDGEGAFATTAALIAVSRRVVENAQHRRQAVGLAVRSGDVRVRRADVLHSEADSARVFANRGAVAERLENSFDGIFVHV